MSRCVNMEAMICLFTSQVVKFMQALRVRGRAVVTYMNKVQEYNLFRMTADRRAGAGNTKSYS